MYVWSLLIDTLNPGKIFIIDDDRLTILVSERILLNYDASLNISSFLSGREALSFFTKNILPENSIILLDINMPEYSGWDFLDDYSLLPLNTKIFMFTSSIDVKDLEKSKTYTKVKGFISKPLTDEKIRQLLEASIS